MNLIGGFGVGGGADNAGEDNPDIQNAAQEPVDQVIDGDVGAEGGRGEALEVEELMGEGGNNGNNGAAQGEDILTF